MVKRYNGMKGLTLHESLLIDHNREDLMGLADLLGLKGVSSFRKRELAEMVADALLVPDVMRDYMAVLRDHEIAAFETVLKTGTMDLGDREGADEWEELSLYSRLEDLGYLAYMEGCWEVVPEDVAEAYRLIDNDEFHALRRERSWLADCLFFFASVRGIAPFKEVAEAYNRREGFHKSEDELLEMFTFLPDQNVTLVDGCIVSGVLSEEVLGQAHIGGKIFSCGTIGAGEIEGFARYLYPVGEESYRALGDFFETVMEMGRGESGELLMETFLYFSTGGKANDFLDEMDQWEHVILPGGRDLEHLKDLINDAYAHTRMLVLGGCKPMEVLRLLEERSENVQVIKPTSTLAATLLLSKKKELDALGLKYDLDANAVKMPIFFFPKNISGNMVSSVKRVYLDDPCPCRSGKLFKDCCGKK